MPFNYKPTVMSRGLILEIEVWNEDLDGVDAFLGVGQYDVTQFAKYSSGDSGPISIEITSQQGTVAGEIVLNMRSDVKSSDGGGPTLSPETKEQLSFFKSVSLFHSFSEEQLLGLTRKIVERTFEPGQVIVRQGDSGAEFYIVHTGRVSAVA